MPTLVKTPFPYLPISEAPFFPFFILFLITGDSKIRQTSFRFKNRFQMSEQQVFHP